MNLRKIILISTLLILSIIFDNQITSFIISHRVQELNQFFISLDFITFEVFIVVLFFLIFLFKKKEKIPVLLLSFLTTIAITYLLKFTISRPRPLESLIQKSTSSFPSGHTSTALVPLPFLKNYKKFKFLWLAIVLMIAFSRIYLGTHHLTDVVFGAVIGYSISTLFIHLNKKWH